MAGRIGGSGRGRKPTAELLVCIPSRPHLKFTPKPICSPGRAGDTPKRHHRRSRGPPSPLFRSKPKPELPEPTSPKVTCSGNVKVKSSSGGCRTWKSVMEDMEGFHKVHRRTGWSGSFPFKKDILQFLACMRGLRFQCFGSLHGAVMDDYISSVDDEAQSQEDLEHSTNGSDESGAMVSKWFTTLQEKENSKLKDMEEEYDHSTSPTLPPSNALLLMRSRSAPGKGFERKNAQMIDGEFVMLNGHDHKFMNYPPEFFMLSADIVKETWLVGRDSFSRSRSCKA